MVTTVRGFVNYELHDLIAISTNFDNISLHGALLGLDVSMHRVKLFSLKYIYIYIYIYIYYFVNVNHYYYYMYHCLCVWPLSTFIGTISYLYISLFCFSYLFILVPAYKDSPGDRAWTV